MEADTRDFEGTGGNSSTAPEADSGSDPDVSFLLPASDAATLTAGLNLTNEDNDSDAASAFELTIGDGSYNAESWSWNTSLHKSISAETILPGSNQPDTIDYSIDDAAAIDADRDDIDSALIEDDADATLVTRELAVNDSMAGAHDAADGDAASWWGSADPADDSAADNIEQDAASSADALIDDDQHLSADLKPKQGLGDVSEQESAAGDAPAAAKPSGIASSVKGLFSSTFKRLRGASNDSELHNDLEPEQDSALPWNDDAEEQADHDEL